jgi:hypothetical protein
MINFWHGRRRMIRTTNGTCLTIGTTPYMRKSAEFTDVAVTAQQESLLCSNQSFWRCWRRIAGEKNTWLLLNWIGVTPVGIHPSTRRLHPPIVGPSAPPYIVSALLCAKPMINGRSRLCETIDDDATFPQLHIQSFQ